MPMRHRGRPAKNSSILARLTRLRITTAPAPSTPCTWNTDFAISRPIVITSPMDGSPQCGAPYRNHFMALRCRRVGAVHSIKLRRLRQVCGRSSSTPTADFPDGGDAKIDDCSLDQFCATLILRGQVRHGMLKLQSRGCRG